MKKISQNPFRVLGVYSNASARELISNATRLKRYASIGKEADFLSGYHDLGTNLNRDEDAINIALASINLPDDKMENALFWFINASPADELALDHLSNGNVEKAREIWSKKDTYSSLINRSIMDFIQGHIFNAVTETATVITCDDYREAFCHAVIAENYSMSEELMMQKYIDILLQEIDAEKLLNIFAASEYDNVAQFVQKKYDEIVLKTLKETIDKTSRTNTSSEKSLRQSINDIMSCYQTIKRLEGHLGRGNLNLKPIVERASSSLGFFISRFYEVSEPTEANYRFVLTALETAKELTLTDDGKKKSAAFLAKVSKDGSIFRCNTLTDFRNYLMDHPDGRYKHIALKAIEEDAFKNCHTLQEYRFYISTYPEGSHITEAKKIIEEFQKDEDALWEECSREEDFKGYLSKYPNGTYEAKAKFGLQKKKRTLIFCWVVLFMLLLLTILSFTII